MQSGFIVTAGSGEHCLGLGCRSRLYLRTLLLPLSLCHGHISTVPYGKGVGIRVNCNVRESL